MFQTLIWRVVNNPCWDIQFASEKQHSYCTRSFGTMMRYATEQFLPLFTHYSHDILNVLGNTGTLIQVLDRRTITGIRIVIWVYQAIIALHFLKTSSMSHKHLGHLVRHATKFWTRRILSSDLRMKIEISSALQMRVNYRWNQGLHLTGVLIWWLDESAPQIGNRHL